MAATTLSFSKVGNVWVATTDALGNMILQVKRNTGGQYQHRTVHRLKLCLDSLIDAHKTALMME